jgi:hypothetical protein
MKRNLIIGLVALAIIVGLTGDKLVTSMAVASPWSPAAESEVVSSVLKAAQASDIDRMLAIPVEKFYLPPAGVDVMRIRMEGTYTINGIGTDRVELSGWLACIHREPRPAPGKAGNSWKTSVIDTEFVGFDIRGESKIFGPVRAYLDSERPSFGRAGAIEMPSLSTIKSVIASEYSRGLRLSTSSVVAPCPTPPDCPGCEAALNLIIDMPQLGLKLKTAEAIRNYSFIETIPPVGDTPSFVLAPTALMLDGREVGRLQDSSSKLREVVMRVPFGEAEAGR